MRNADPHCAGLYEEFLRCVVDVLCGLASDAELGHPSAHNAGQQDWTALSVPLFLCFHVLQISFYFETV